MIADVAIKTSVLRLKAASVIPRIAPPVPNNPAVIPENIPPRIEFLTVGFTSNDLKERNEILIITRKQAKMNSKMVVSTYLLNLAPIMTNITAGIPIVAISFLSKPVLKR